MTRGRTIMTLQRSIAWRDVRVNRVYTYAPIPGDQASLKFTAFDGLIFLYVQKLFKIMIVKEKIKNPFHDV